MARKRDTVVKLNLRLPKELHRQLERTAARSKRSLNSEIIERLKRGFIDEWARRLQVQALSTYKLDEQLMDMVKKALMDISDHLATAWAEAEERSDVELATNPTPWVTIDPAGLTPKQRRAWQNYQEATRKAKEQREELEDILQEGLPKGKARFDELRKYPSQSKVGDEQ